MVLATSLQFYQLIIGFRFAKDEEDGVISRTLFPSQLLSTVAYNISITTGDAKGSGTDANVFIVLFGQKVGHYSYGLTMLINYLGR